MISLAVITIIVQLIFLESLLSIDNAAVLGAMAAPLPDNEPVPWPHWLRWQAEFANRILGMQREAALRVGLIGAYVGRTAMLFAATFIINNPWLRIIGAAYLVYLAIEHIANLDDGNDHDPSQIKKIHRVGFWPTVLAIEFADLAFSLDNVVAAVAASIFTRMVEWEPALQTGAYLLVLSIGVELLLKEFLDVHIGEFTQFSISLLILAVTIMVARSPIRTLDFLWKPIITFFKVLYAPFAAMQQLMHRGV
jgi:tellurite resistance protein TerC